MDLRLTTGRYGWLLWVIPLILILVLLAAVIIVASIRDLTSLEIIMFQVLTLGIGLFGSFWLGRSSAIEAARDVVRPHARSSLRTILLLQDSLYRLSIMIEEFKQDDGDIRLDRIQTVVNEQIPIGRSAVEDWRDVVPDDVDEVLKRWVEQGEV